MAKKTPLPHTYTYLLILEYDGAAFFGWQRQPHRRTVQSELEKALQALFQCPCPVIGASRTDTGVHARQQAAVFSVHRIMDTRRIAHALNYHLPDDIAVTSVQQVPSTFNPRYMAVKKTYEYRIWNHEIRPVIDRQSLWHIPQPLSISRMRRAANKLLGTHDFSSFCGSQGMQKDKMVTINSIAITKKGAHITIVVSANRFLYHMVRMLVGTLVSVGLMKHEPSIINELLRPPCRIPAGPTAPARGLTLEKIVF